MNQAITLREGFDLLMVVDVIVAQATPIAAALLTFCLWHLFQDQVSTKGHDHYELTSKIILCKLIYFKDILHWTWIIVLFSSSSLALSFSWRMASACLSKLWQSFSYSHIYIKNFMPVAPSWLFLPLPCTCTHTFFLTPYLPACLLGCLTQHIQCILAQYPRA